MVELINSLENEQYVKMDNKELRFLSYLRVITWWELSFKGYIRRKFAERFWELYNKELMI